jgi:hypothetical protein
MAIVFEIPVEGVENLGSFEPATNLNRVPRFFGEPGHCASVASNHVRYVRQPDNLLRADHRRLTLQSSVQQRSPVFA